MSTFEGAARSPARVGHAAPLRSLLLLSLALSLVACAGPQGPDAADIELSDYHYQLSIGHYQAREVPIAIRELQEALRLNPQNANALFMMGFIYHGRRDFTEAIRYYQAALEAREDWFEAMNNLGTAYLEVGEWERAADLFRALTRAPTYTTPGHAHNNLGWSLYRMGQHREALEQFQLAVMFQPEHCLAYNNQGLVHEELGNPREAAEAYERAIRRCSGYAEPRFRLGRLLITENGDLQRARRVLQECSDLAPEGRTGRRCREYLEVLP